MVGIIIGVILILFTIGAIVMSLAATPDNLEGFYGAMFWTIGASGLIGGLYLIVSNIG